MNWFDAECFTKCFSSVVAESNIKIDYSRYMSYDVERRLDDLDRIEISYNSEAYAICDSAYFNNCEIKTDFSECTTALDCIWSEANLLVDAKWRELISEFTNDVSRLLSDLELTITDRYIENFSFEKTGKFNNQKSNSWLNLSDSRMCCQLDNFDVFLVVNLHTDVEIHPEGLDYDE